MGDSRKNLMAALLVLGLVHLVFLCAVNYHDAAGIHGLFYADGEQPVGNDFLNLWTVGRMLVTGHVGEIYSTAGFKAYQATLTGGVYTGLRLWAYPPHSLFFVWPFGFLGYYVALAVWSLLGLAVLFAAARRFGFGRLEIAVLLLSPATVLNIYHGQTGSVVTGLMLFALSARRPAEQGSACAAALLTVKPQAGFLLPVLWTIERRWQTMAIAAAASVLLVAASVAVFGSTSWRGYLGDTLPALNNLEQHGRGPFMRMIPSAFMAMRIVTGDTDLSLLVHGIFAAAVGLVLLWRLWRVRDAERRAAMVLVATVLITPYMHNYDLGLLLCGALVVARRPWVAEGGLSRLGLVVLPAWILPQLVLLLNAAGTPISPFLILPLLFMA